MKVVLKKYCMKIMNEIIVQLRDELFSKDDFINDLTNENIIEKFETIVRPLAQKKFRQSFLSVIANYELRIRNERASDAFTIICKHFDFIKIIDYSMKRNQSEMQKIEHDLIYDPCLEQLFSLFDYSLKDDLNLEDCGSSQKEYTNHLFEEIVENSKQIKKTKKRLIL
jgi:hypothetical protein